MRKLTIVIPVFNEQATILQTLDRVLRISLPRDVSKEIIVVDDASSDGTSSILSNNEKKLGFKLFMHKINQGKGKAVMTGIKHSTGDYIVIQDADLEYNPHDILNLIKPIIQEKAKVVYGTRLNRLPELKKDMQMGKSRFLIHYFGNRFLSLITSLLYGQWLTDMETCYKVFPKKALENFTIHARGFEFEPEITAKLLKNGYHIHEIPITTRPRGSAEGKKLNTVSDGLRALLTLIRYRFRD